VMPPSYRGKAFVAKLSGEGDLLYATWLAGNGEDLPAVLAADANGEVVVLGTTTSNTFPVVNALQERNASGGGVAWSGDAGQTWLPRNAGLPYNAFVEIVTGLFESGTAYACAPEIGIYRTTDSGATWQPANKGIPLTPTPNVRQVAASRAAPGLLFAFAVAGIVRSDDGGQSWNVVPSGQSPQGIFPDPRSRETLYTLLAVPPSGSAGQPDFHLMRTDNGAQRGSESQRACR
jgi:hypothetical protein